MDTTIVIIGAGRMGRRHISVAKNLGMHITGIVDLRPDQALEACREHGLPEGIARTEVGDVLSPAPGALVVATTAPSHCELVCAAAASGVRYILCEKPMAVSADEAERMRRTCERHGSRLAVNHQVRYMPQYSEVKRMVDEPELGGLLSMLVCGSNIGLAMNGSHYFEIFRHISGEDVREITAWLETGLLPNPRGPQFEDRSGRVLAVTAGQKTLFMDISGAAGHGLHAVYICRHGQIVVDELSGSTRYVHRRPEDRELPTSRYGTGAVERTLQLEQPEVVKSTEALWQAMLSGAPYPDADAGEHSLRCLLAAQASDEAGHVAIGLHDPRIDRSRRWAWA